MNFTNQSSVKQPLFLTCDDDDDDAYAMPMGVILRSILENTSEHQDIIAFVIDAGIKDCNKKKILNSLNQSNFHLKWIPSPNSLPKNFPISYDILPHVSRTAYYRLLLPNILPIDCKKVIHLDNDLIVLRDLNDLWQVDTESSHVLAVQDPYIPYISSPYALKRYKDLDILEDSKYFNSGVLVINLEIWRNEDLATKFIQCLIENTQYIQYHDQDVLNAILANKWKELEPKWNQTPHLFSFSLWMDSPFSEKEFFDAMSNPCIVHFASSSKPWNSLERHPMKHLFFHYFGQDLLERMAIYIEKTSMA